MPAEKAGPIEQTVGVFGEEMLLWICALAQSPQRPPADHVHRQANHMLDELKGSMTAQALQVQSVDDALFAIAALLDEWAMAMPDLRPYWSQYPLQSRRWMTNNAGVELFQRLDQRVKAGPKSILATYLVVLGLGFQGRYGLPGADRYAPVQIRRDLGVRFGVDPDRDWKGGVLKPTRSDAGPSELLEKPPWWKTVWFGRGLAIGLFVIGATALAIVLAVNLG